MSTDADPPREQAVEEAELLFRYFVESVTEYALFTVSTTGLVASWNVGASRTFGYATKDIIGKHFETLFAPDDIARRQPASELAVALKDGRVERDCWHRRADGTRFRATDTVQPLRNDAGNVIGFSHIVRDSTERYVAHMALQESDERFRLLVENMADYAIVFLSPAGRIGNWNSGAESMFGYAAEEILDSTISRLCTPRAIGDDFVRPRSGPDAADLTSGERWCFRKDGSSFFATTRLAGLASTSPGVDRGHLMIIHDIAHRKDEEEALRRKAFYDELTGLPNRALFLERCAVARNRASEEYGFAVLFLDIDNFKMLDDKYGHAIGDAILKRVADGLERSVRPEDFVARLSGDEFAILLEQVDTTGSAIEVAERARLAIAVDYDIEGTNIRVTSSVGVARGTRHDRLEQVLRQADFAMYEAKRRGRNQYATFTAGIGGQGCRRTREEAALREALERQELFVEYQPVVEVAQLRIVGFEAFVRWMHPERGVLAAAQFIPLAEATGLIVPIDRWVFKAAVSQLRLWQLTTRNEQLFVSVNLSTTGLARPDALSSIRDDVQRSHVTFGDVKIEIAESPLLEAPANVVATLAGLREFGMELYLDDFGASYSNFDSLRRCGATALKIDRSFVSGISSNGGNAELVRAIVSLAHTLRLRTIAQGVDTEAELAMLRDAHCDFAQGYLFGRPASADAATATLGAAAGDLPRPERYGRRLSLVPRTNGQPGEGGDPR